jgi:hypothetical protein
MRPGKRRETARAKYADEWNKEWNKAGFLKRIRLHFLIWRESQNPKQTGHRPSPGTLW